MQVQKLKLAAYALAKRIQGYRLLQNPENASELYLRMIKSETQVRPDLSVSNYFDRITKDFGKKSKTLEEIVYSYHYYPQKPNDKKQKYISYLNLNTFQAKEKGEVLGGRHLVSHRKYDELRNNIMVKERYYKPSSTVIGRIIDFLFGGVPQDLNKPERPKFFSVLRKNLNIKS